MRRRKRGKQSRNAEKSWRDKGGGPFRRIIKDFVIIFTRLDFLGSNAAKKKAINYRDEKVLETPKLDTAAVSMLCNRVVLLP